MPTAVVLREPRSWTHPISDAFVECFRRRGWTVTQQDSNDTTGVVVRQADIFAGYGWGPGMQAAYARHPERIVHVDLAFWGRESHYKLALGGRWSPLVDREYDDSRFAMHRLKIQPSRKPGRKILVCGMSEKAARDWGCQPEAWERDAIKRLHAAGAEWIIYRPKPTWAYSTKLPGADLDKQGRPIGEALGRVDAVVSHHSNCAVDALAAGLPVYVDIGIAKPLSVTTLEDVIGAEALGIETRTRFLRQVAWHQWTLREISEGAWLKPPAPLAGHPMLLNA